MRPRRMMSKALEVFGSFRGGLSEVDSDHAFFLAAARKISYNLTTYRS